MLQTTELGADLPPGTTENPVAEHVLVNVYQYIIMVIFPADNHKAPKHQAPERRIKTARGIVRDRLG